MKVTPRSDAQHFNRLDLMIKAFRGEATPFSPPMTPPTFSAADRIFLLTLGIKAD